MVAWPETSICLRLALGSFTEPTVGYCGQQECDWAQHKNCAALRSWRWHLDVWDRLGQTPAKAEQKKEALEAFNSTPSLLTTLLGTICHICHMTQFIASGQCPRRLSGQRCWLLIWLCVRSSGMSLSTPYSIPLSVLVPPTTDLALGNSTST